MASVSKALIFIFTFLLAGCLGETGGDAPLPSGAGCNPCRMFVTDSPYEGTLENMGTGPLGGDSVCATDPLNPGDGSTFKAMVVDGTTRRACVSANCEDDGTSEHIDWVLQKNTAYTRLDGTFVTYTSPGGVFEFNFSNTIGGGTNTTFWTGLNADFTTGDDCSGWNSNSSALTTTIGDATSTGTAAISSTTIACDGFIGLLCVEQ